MELFVQILLLITGIALLLKGADWLVDGSVALARRLGVSSLVIGLTVVAMGTSAPEVAASVRAAMKGFPDIAVGNVYGSNIANLALVAGLCGLIRPIRVTGAVLIRDIPIMLVSALLLFPILFDLNLSRPESLLLLVVFTVSIIWMILSEKRGKSIAIPEKPQTPFVHPSHTASPLPANLLRILAGLVALTLGARFAVGSSCFIGERLGISQAVIGLTVVAVGTSLPELLTCLVASFKGHDDLSIGNLVGSNIFNTLLVLGAAGMTKPLAVSASFIRQDYAFMLITTAVFAFFALVSGKITRPAAFVLLAVYIVYITFLFSCRSSLV